MRDHQPRVAPDQRGGDEVSPEPASDFDHDQGVVHEPLDHEGKEERRSLKGPTKARLRERDLGGGDGAEH